MDSIVEPFQASFIKGQQIHDNIIVGQEIMHTMKRARGRKGLMAIKIDLENAYDRIRWNFVKLVLQEAGMEDKFISMIMECISSVSYNILWNGATSKFFPAKRGLR